ncbi:MAG: hypothetical protein KAJ19_27175 [Gammaproteobacteria bacterium]|nr:hypothetical protein [Gammaproteobacteria bacterium]
MSFLMHICFDNDMRFERDKYYLEYNEVRFKLIQNNPRKWSDVLITIVPHNDPKSEQKAYAAAGEFLSALSWQNGAKIALRPAGGMGLPGKQTLRSMKCRVFDFPQIPFSGHHVGYRINILPDVKTDEQRKALALAREAHSSNNIYLSFLFYWNAMQVGQGDPYNWVTSTYKRYRSEIGISPNDIKQLPLAGKNLGEYLYQDCRCAIAHVKPRPDRRRIQIDVVDDIQRLHISTRVVRAFSEHYIRNKLRLKNNRYLCRKKGRGFPVFLTENEMKNNSYTLAY